MSTFLSPRLSRIVMVSAMAVGLGLAGCGGSETTPSDSPTATTAPTNASSTPAPETIVVDPDWEGVTDDLALCLATKSIPVTVHQISETEQELLFDPVSYAIYRLPNGKIIRTYAPDTEPLPESAIERHMSVEGPVLILDGEDRSYDYRTCLVASQVVEVDKETQRSIDASTKWARCARENGWPDIKDPGKPKTNQIPQAIIPSTMTINELEKLLTDCPPLDKTVDPPARPYITVSSSDGTDAGEAARSALLVRINEIISGVEFE